MLFVSSLSSGGKHLASDKLCLPSNIAKPKVIELSYTKNITYCSDPCTMQVPYQLLSQPITCGSTKPRDVHHIIWTTLYIIQHLNLLTQITSAYAMLPNLHCPYYSLIVLLQWARDHLTLCQCRPTAITPHLLFLDLYLHQKRTPSLPCCTPYC